MKKIVTLICLTLVAQNSPMNAPALAARCAWLALSTTPVTLPGAYYYRKTERVKKECLQNTGIFDTSSQDEYRHFVQGAVYGVVPPINAFVLILGGVAFGTGSFMALNDWANGKPIPISQLSSDPKFSWWRATGTGFAAGLSLWVTVPEARYACEKVITKEAALIKLLRRGR